MAIKNNDSSFLIFLLHLTYFTLIIQCLLISEFFVNWIKNYFIDFIVAILNVNQIKVKYSVNSVKRFIFLKKHYLNSARWRNHSWRVVKMWIGGAGYRSRYLSHAKRALYHLSYAPWNSRITTNGQFICKFITKKFYSPIP